MPDLPFQSYFKLNKRDPKFHLVSNLKKKKKNVPKDTNPSCPRAIVYKNSVVFFSPLSAGDGVELL